MLKDIFEKHQYRVGASADRYPEGDTDRLKHISKDNMSRRLAEHIMSKADIEWDDFMSEMVATMEVFVFTRKELVEMLHSIEAEVMKKAQYMKSDMRT